MIFPSREEVLRIHAQLIDRYGGPGGLRDEGLLLSALAQPQATFDGHFLHTDIWEMAAAYAFHLCQNHAFVDGNKRIALAVMLVFLELNDHPVHADPAELFAVMLALAEGRLTKAALAEWLRVAER